MRNVTETIIAAAIFGAPIYLSWLYFGITGHALRF